MNLRTLAAAGIAATLGLSLAAPAAIAAPGDLANPRAKTAQVPLERQVLASDDGWASANGGTTGGALAAPEHVYDVSTRAEMLAAFADAGDAPKIIRVHGTIHANSDDAGNPLTCEQVAAGTGYSLPAYLEAYDPATWGKVAPAGVQEEARKAAAKIQSNLITLKVPSNTTIVGADQDARLTGSVLRLDGVHNVIIRNLNLNDTYDCFPAWDPNDGAYGEWNSEYDMVQVINKTTNVWVDHVAFTDAPMTDDKLPTYFGRTFQRHDGALDVTNGSDYVTVSWNDFSDHDKLMLIGSTDSTTRGDVGKLNVTIHHNLFNGVGQRAPRVRFGHVDVYNNHYVISDAQTVEYVYSLGVGKDSHIWAENNYFSVSGDIALGDIIGNYKGTMVHTEGNVINGKKADLLALHNAAHDPDLADDTSWTPTLRTKVSPANAVPAQVDGRVGPIFG